MVVKRGKKSGKRVQSLPARKLTSKQAKGVKGGSAVALPAVQAEWKLSSADGSVRPVSNQALKS